VVTVSQVLKYDEAIEWLYGTQLFGIKLGLESVAELLEHLNVPDDLEGRQIIHVAGTNGKGSVCAFSERILREAGFRTGLFTSPHLVSFRERIRIDGTPASQSEIAGGLTVIREIAKTFPSHPTFFEITFALGMRIFCDRNCERIILETGMGGRLDATNALSADVNVITPISMDHQQWLGDTMEKIATEKAGIIQPDTPVITGDLNSVARDVIGRRALKAGAPLIEAHLLPDDWELGLKGPHQRKNAALAVEAVCRVDDSSSSRLTPQVISHALARIEWPGRFQLIGSHLILDGAHNVAAVEALVAAWRDTFGEGERSHLVFGVASSKNVSGILEMILPIVSSITFVPIQSERRASVEDMKKSLLEAGGGHLPSRDFSSVAEALDYGAGLEEKTLVAGSLFLVGEALAHLQGGHDFEVSSQ